jgi:hypothetical protein
LTVALKPDYTILHDKSNHSRKEIVREIMDWSFDSGQEPVVGSWQHNNKPTMSFLFY